MNMDGKVLDLIQKKKEEIQNSTQLCISWIQTSEELTAALNSGLTELYQKIFADPPYNESFSDKDVFDGFQQTLDAQGLLFVASDPANRQPVAFVSSVPLAQEPEICATFGAKIDPLRTAYFAEDGVAKDNRRRGISNKMKELLLTANFATGMDRVVLRTSIYNYPQIAAVSKAGGVVASGLTQDVPSMRQNGTVVADTRVFYIFDKNWSERARNGLAIERLTIVRPGGNDTAFVWDAVSRDRQKGLSLEIQSIYPGVEQVMFVEPPTLPGAVCRGQMAGGEFCGNATRSLGYLVLEGADGETKLEISGATHVLNVHVRDGYSRTAIPILNDIESVRPAGNPGEYYAKLEGISFLVTKPDLFHGQVLESLPTLEERKRYVVDILQAPELKDDPASGVLLVHDNADGSMRLDPYVYVRDTGTLYYETGCGSGSTSVGLMLAKIGNKSIQDKAIVQPSGMPLLVSVDRDEERFLGATVNGPVRVLLDGPVVLPDSKASRPLTLG